MSGLNRESLAVLAVAAFWDLIPDDAIKEDIARAGNMLADQVLKIVEDQKPEFPEMLHTVPKEFEPDGELRCKQTIVVNGQTVRCVRWNKHPEGHQVRHPRLGETNWDFDNEATEPVNRCISVHDLRIRCHLELGHSGPHTAPSQITEHPWTWEDKVADPPDGQGDRVMCDEMRTGWNLLGGRQILKCVLDKGHAGPHENERGTKWGLRSLTKHPTTLHAMKRSPLCQCDRHSRSSDCPIHGNGL